MIAQINKEYIRTRIWKLYSRFISYGLFEGRPLTTTGRWFNSIVFLNLKLCQILPFAKKVKKPVFIIGTGRSGSTILGIILSMHKHIGYLNEPKALWHEIYEKEDIIGSYSEIEGSYRLQENDANKKVIKKAHTIFGHYLNYTFSKTVVDKYPELVFRVNFIKKIFPDAKFIFLTRNGWSTCVSIENWSKRLGLEDSNEVHNWWGKDNRKWHIFINEILKQDNYYKDVVPEINKINNHTDMAALEWIASMREGLSMLKKYPESVLNIKYEDLVFNSKKSLKDLEDFMEIEHDETFIEYGEKILSPVKEKDAVVLNEKVFILFKDTMQKLNYKV